MASVAPAVAASANDRVVLYNVDWQTYENLRNDLGESPVRLTYDGNNLEIMSPSRQHEHVKMVLTSLITLLTVELKIPLSNGGSMTFRRADLKRGLEPDACYWIAHESDVRGRNELDLTTDPPPDLAIEVDISPSRLDRPKIYAALRIPELWRYDGEALQVEILHSDGTYHPSEASASFPFLPVRELARFLAISEIEGDGPCQIAFVQWLREQNFEV
jgi:Uma2 family endonuclease